MEIFRKHLSPWSTPAVISNGSVYLYGVTTLVYNVINIRLAVYYIINFFVAWEIYKKPSNHHFSAFWAKLGKEGGIFLAVSEK